MATATTFSLVMAKGSPNGERKIFTTTASDVNGEYLIFQSGSSEITFGMFDSYLVDMITGSTTGDCSLLEFYRGGTTDGTRMLKSSLGGTNVNRPPQLSPYKVASGQSFKVKQIT